MLTPGARLGPYEIVQLLGAGGMGEVYRARDTRLNRDVAVKVLQPAVAGDPERLARFRREAQTLAALNHPNIAHIHGFEDIDGLPALVMELVEGDDLAVQIAGRRLRIDEALPIARQIAVALAAAHEQGIIHRDLKPANIKVRPDGTVKVLDFGLAKALDPLASSPAAAALANSPTITTPAALTGAGVILGTAAYMSPEQARGKAVDKRCDLWAFGAVLFEMLAGARAFRGDDVTDTIASVIAKEPDWDKLPAGTPAAIRRLIRRCLEKDPSRRLSDASDARLEIDEALTTPAGDAPPATGATAPRWAAWVPVAAGLAGVALGAVVVLLAWAPWQHVSPPQFHRLSVDSGTDSSVTIGLGDSTAISPDGTLVVFVAQPGVAGRPQLYARPLNQLRATPLAGTEDANSPFFAPDGQWVAFFAGNKLKKVAVGGGAVVSICDAENGRGGSWGDDGEIVFSTFSPGVAAERSGLLRVSSASGVPRLITAIADREVTQRWPQLLPGGKGVLFTTSRNVGDYVDANLIVQTLPLGARKVVHAGGFHGRYLPSGHLAYIHDETLFAAPFDLDRLAFTGPPVPIFDDVQSNASTGAAQFAASANGTFVYVAGKGAAGVPISWLGRDGTITPLRVTPANWFDIKFSPDGRRLAMAINGGRARIGIYEAERDAMTFLPNGDLSDAAPEWTPDGRRLTYASAPRSAPVPNLYWQPVDGTGEAQRLTDSRNAQAPGSWHPGGRFLAFEERVGPANADLKILPMEGSDASGWRPGTPTVFLSTPSNETEPTFSPDGRWLAYVSDESGSLEVYVRPFQGSGKWRISSDGGAHPTWSRARRELFYATNDGQIMMVTTAVEGDAFRAGKPQRWSETRFGARASRMFDLHPDGKRFAVAPAVRAEPGGRDRLTFVFNFFDELRRLAPAAKR